MVRAAGTCHRAHTVERRTPAVGAGGGGRLAVKRPDGRGLQRHLLVPALPNLFLFRSRRRASRLFGQPWGPLLFQGAAVRWI